MTYQEAKQRVMVYWAAQVSFAGLAMLILFTLIIKTFYYASAPSRCMIAQAPCSLYRNLVEDGYRVLSPVSKWVWTFLPNFAEIPGIYLLLNPQGMMAIFFILFAAFLSSRRVRLRSLIRQAEDSAQVAGFAAALGAARPHAATLVANAASNLQAGRDIILTQTFRDWDKKPSQNPTITALIGVGGTVLASVLGAALLSMLGLKG